MPLITRQGKGSKLTIVEMDGNLTYLETLGLSGSIGPQGAAGSAGSTGAAGPQGSTGNASNLVGTTTNDDASAGNVGEYISSVIGFASPISLVNATPANITSISLTAGDWDVSGIAAFSASGATVTYVNGSINSVSVTPNVLAFSRREGAITQMVSIAIAPLRFSLAATTTIYLVSNNSFSSGTLSAFGRIDARRVR